MSKFFTFPSGLLLAWVFPALASSEMNPPPAQEAPAVSSPGGSGLPVPLDGNRFAALSKKSPFTLASTTEENADFAKDLLLAGYVRIEGQDFVMIANRSNPNRLMVGTKPSPAAQGMVLVKVERDPSGDPTKLTAQIRKGTETATLKYEAAAPSPGGAPPGQPVPGQPQPGQPQPGQPQASVPPQVPGAAPGSGGQKPGPAVIRRRVVPIPPLPSR